MNRYICEHPAQVSDANWPPACRGDRLRVLCLSSQVLGLVRFGSAIEQGMAVDDTIDAVHIRLRSPTWLRALGKSMPGLRGWDCHVLRHRALWTQRVCRWFNRYIPVDHFDLLHVMNQHNAMPLLRIRGGRSPATVVAIDATAKSEMRDFGYGPIDRAILARGERRLFNGVDAVACMSGWAADSVERDYGIHADRVIRTRIGLHPHAILKPGIPPPRRGLLRIAFVGNDWVRKGGDRLLGWHQSRWSERVELHLVGRGCPNVRGARNVVWHGAVQHDRLLSELLPSMDLSVLPTHEDTLVFALLEAQACGVPVVASRLAGIASDAVRDGITGILCDASDDAAFIQAIEHLIDDPKRRAAMAAAARDWVGQAWSPEAGIRRYLGQLHRVAQARFAGGGQACTS